MFSVKTLPLSGGNIAAFGREHCHLSSCSFRLGFIKELHNQAYLTEGETDVVFALATTIELVVKLRITANPAVQLVQGRTLGNMGRIHVRQLHLQVGLDDELLFTFFGLFCFLFFLLFHNDVFFQVTSRQADILTCHLVGLPSVCKFILSYSQPSGFTKVQGSVLDPFSEPSSFLEYTSISLSTSCNKTADFSIRLALLSDNPSSLAFVTKSE